MTPVPGELPPLPPSLERIVLFTGAGVSRESGLPTFREAQTGIWARFSPEELATPEAFRANPERVWSWYAWRRELVRGASPNPAHRAIARLEVEHPGVTVITQNVDGLHRRAGSRRVLELHGDILRTICSRDFREVEEGEGLPGTPPRCPECGSPLRPDVVWFGEALPAETLSAAFEAAAACDLLLVVGTSGRVYPAAGIVPVALEGGAPVWVVDPSPAPWDHPAVHSFQGEAGVLVPLLVEHLLGRLPIG